jgi:hypothetical protein
VKSPHGGIECFLEVEKCLLGLEKQVKKINFITQNYKLRFCDFWS